MQGKPKPQGPPKSPLSQPRGRERHASRHLPFSTDEQRRTPSSATRRSRDNVKDVGTTRHVARNLLADVNVEDEDSLLSITTEARVHNPRLKPPTTARDDINSRFTSAFGNTKFGVGREFGTTVLGEATTNATYPSNSAEGRNNQRREFPSTTLENTEDATPVNARSETPFSTGSRSTLSRRTHLVYEIVVKDAKLKKYKCQKCNRFLGTSRNTTRFVKHCVEDCEHIHSPLKEELARLSKSKRLGIPRSRSQVARALERSNLPEIDEPILERSRTENSLNNSRRGSLKAGARKRGNSTPSGSPLAKRRRLSRERLPRIDECSEEEAQNIINSIMGMIVLRGLPFNIFDRVAGGQDSPETEYAYWMRPGFAERYLPNSQSLANKHLNEFHSKILTNVKERVKTSLEIGYGSIIFDGWTDINKASVVNVLLRTESNVNAGRRVFFLKSVYTGSDRVGAAEYVKLLEDVMKDYGGLERICAITSDNTSSCLNTRRMITEKYMGIIGINDQNHVADLLIEDIGKIPWVKDVIEKVAALSTDLHSRGCGV